MRAILSNLSRVKNSREVGTVKESGRSPHPGGEEAKARLTPCALLEVNPEFYVVGAKQ